MAKTMERAAVTPVSGPVPRDDHYGRVEAGGEGPKFGQGKPAASGPIPRVIDQLERATDGAKRFRVSCHNYQPKPVRYVLARSEDEAIDAYKANVKLPEELKRVQGRNTEKPDDPEIVCVALAD
jgi:hypothetical protein